MIYYGSNDWRDYLAHYGVAGMKWGVRNGPPYPLRRTYLIRDAIDNKEVSTRINQEKQARHIKGNGYIDGRSYLNPGEDPQKLVDELSMTGRATINRDGTWKRKELVTAKRVIGVNVDPVTGKERKTRKAVIHYSKTGTHIVPGEGGKR